MHDIFLAEHAEGHGLDGIRFLKFHRLVDPADEHAVTLVNQQLRKAFNHFLGAAQLIEQMPEAQALQTIAKTSLDCEFLHPKANGNHRLFGLLMTNLLLAKAGLPLAVIDDPNLSDGASYEQVADMIQEAMVTAKGWLKKPTAAA